MDTPAVDVSQDDSGVWLISLSGEHDLSTVPALQTALDEVFAYGTRILIDLSETTFIDSTILTTLVEAQRHSDQQADERLIVVAPPGGRPAALFELIQAHEFLRVAENRDAALRDFTTEPRDNPESPE